MATVREPADRLTWEQALAWRAARHHFVERAAQHDILRVVGDICGLHAQLMSSAELSLWARVDGLERDALDDLLWEQRALVKLWAMRGTLHLLPSAELGLWVSALSTYTNRGMTGHPEIDVLIDAVGRALEGRVLTREELAREVEHLTGDPTYAEYVRFSWGSYLKPGSFRGLLCFAQSAGNLVRFTAPADFIPGGITRLDPLEALRTVTRRALAAYAPLTAADLALWWGGFGPAPGRRMLAALGDEALEIEIEGERVWMLAPDVEEMASVVLTETARLLPAFDPWVAGASRASAAVVDPVHRSRVYRPQGWISPVVLVNGRMAGVWKHARKGSRLLVEIAPFDRLTVMVREQLEIESARLAEFLGGDLSVKWET